jgi:hypothetical protein
MNAWRDFISPEIDVSKKLDAVFNFPKIHLISLLVKQIRGYGALQQFSAEGHEKAHNTNPQHSGNASNHTLNYLLQVISFNHLILRFQIREHNVQTLAQGQENSEVACRVSCSGADSAAPMSTESYTTPEFMGPQICHDGKHPDTMIKDFRT